MIEQRHAAPQFDMHLLQQVGAVTGIGLVAPSQPSKRQSKEPIRLFVQFVLLAAVQEIPSDSYR
jgi:hypothetical protein